MEEQQESVRRKSVGILKSLQPYFLNVLANCCFAGFNIVSKVSLDKGMSRYVLVVYGHAIGMLITAVLALFFERTNGSKINLPILRNIFFLGVLGPVLGRTLFYAGLVYTSPAFASAMGNIILSMTLILAILCRMEKLDILKVRSQAKIGGTVAAFAGATLMTLYKGIIIISLPSQRSNHSAPPSGSLEKNWIKGSLLLIVSYFSLSAFYILQAATIKIYPAPISLTSLTCLMGTVQAALMTLVIERRASSWRLNWDISLLAPIYSGVVLFGVTIYIQTLVTREKGPVFMTAFRPLATIIVAVMGLLILGEALHLGSVLGAVFIVVGLYVVLWGKGKEEGKRLTERDPCDQGIGIEAATITAVVRDKIGNV